MPFLPFNILGIWLRGLLSVAILAGGLYLLKRWYEESQVVEPVRAVASEEQPLGDGADRDRGPERGPEEADRAPTHRVFRFNPGWNRETAFLAAGIALLAWAVVGRWIGQGVAMLLGRRSRPASADDEPRHDRTGEVHRLRRPDGSELQVECYGPSGAMPIILTHGWGANGTEWWYPKRHLTDRFRLIVWDEPGLGLSKKPDNNDYRLEKLAADLEAVLSFAGDRPAVLVGHSIGGMITLTFCRLFPEALGRRVAGLVLVNTTYTNPVRTAKMAALYTALEKPVIVPLLYLTIALWPLVWLLNWMSYLNGSAHRSTHKQSFAGTETQGQLDFVARFMPTARPDVLARGMLGMIAYDATATLPTIGIPVLTVVGDRDTLTPPEAGQFISQNIPKSDLATLAPARHMALIEHHGRFDQLVAEFTDSCLAAGVAGPGHASK